MEAEGEVKEIEGRRRGMLTSVLGRSLQPRLYVEVTQEVKQGNGGRTLEYIYHRKKKRAILE